MPRTHRRLLPILSLALVAACGRPAVAAVACQAPHGWAERTLCQLDDVERLDRRLAAAFADLAETLPVADRARLQGEQRAWMAERDGCRGEIGPAGCLRRRYEARLADLERRESRAEAGRRPPEAVAIEPFVRRARAIDRRLPRLRQRIVEGEGGAAFLWLDGGRPVLLVEPGGGDGGGPALASRYYFDAGGLFLVEGRADRAAFANGEMLLWLDGGGRPPAGAAPLWPQRQQQLLTRAEAWLARFGA